MPRGLRLQHLAAGFVAAYVTLAIFFNKTTIVATDDEIYDLVAVMKSGGERPIVKSLPEPAQSLFLEQRIEERLGIVDVEVGGEYPSEPLRRV